MASLCDVIGIGRRRWTSMMCVVPLIKLSSFLSFQMALHNHNHDYPMFQQMWLCPWSCWSFFKVVQSSNDGLIKDDCIIFQLALRPFLYTSFTISPFQLNTISAGFDGMVFKTHRTATWHWGHLLMRIIFIFPFIGLSVGRVSRKRPPLYSNENKDTSTTKYLWGDTQRQLTTKLILHLQKWNHTKPPTPRSEREDTLSTTLSTQTQLNSVAGLPEVKPSFLSSLFTFPSHQRHQLFWKCLDKYLLSLLGHSNQDVNEGTNETISPWTNDILCSERNKDRRMK